VLGPTTTNNNSRISVSENAASCNRRKTEWTKAAKIELGIKIRNGRSEAIISETFVFVWPQQRCLRIGIVKSEREENSSQLRSPTVPRKRHSIWVGVVYICLYIGVAMWSCIARYRGLRWSPVSGYSRCSQLGAFLRDARTSKSLSSCLPAPAPPPPPLAHRLGERNATRAATQRR